MECFISLLFAPAILPLLGLFRSIPSSYLSMSCKNDYPFKIAWLGLPAGCVITERKNVAVVGFYPLHRFAGGFLFLLEVKNVKSIPSPLIGRFLVQASRGIIVKGLTTDKVTTTSLFFYVTAIYNY